MMLTSACPLRSFIFALCSLACALPAQAGDTSTWDGDARSAVRLIAAATTENGAPKLYSGVEITLKSGWKTYWRYPGDAGIPPRFDFSGSENVRKVAVSWPAPQRIADGEGKTIGYKERVIFPLAIEAQDPAQPVILRLKLDYAICEKLCVPVEAKAELPLTNVSDAQAETLKAAVQNVPKSLPVGAAAPLSIARVSMEKNKSAKQIVVDVATPGQAKVDLFAEGPGPGWSLPLPEPVAGAASGQQRFVFSLEGVPKGVNPAGALLKLTARTVNDAIESTFRID